MSISICGSSTSLSKLDEPLLQSFCSLQITSSSTRELEYSKLSSLSIPSAFASLPPKLHLKIFSNLGHSASTCLGLTCKRLYKIHVELNGKVSISFFKHPRLHLLLKNWMAPKYTWEIFCDRFITMEEYETLWRSKERRYEEGWKRLDEWAEEGISD